MRMLRKQWSDVFKQLQTFFTDPETQVSSFFTS
jgi:hypothetical protein